MRDPTSNGRIVGNVPIRQDRERLAPAILKALTKLAASSASNFRLPFS
jgi:hypothetical protein